jgi:hypothetical protein
VASRIRSFQGSAGSGTHRIAAASDPAIAPAMASDRTRWKRMAVEITTVMATGMIGLWPAPVSAAAATTKIPLSAVSAQAVHKFVSPRRASRVVLMKASHA